MRRIPLVLSLLMALLACGDGGLEPLPLEITLASNRATASPGQAISFTVTAQGDRLLGIELDFGDGNVEEVPTAGARTARLTREHSYVSRGTYRVRASVSDATAAMREATLQIVVN
jgi:hypothetical protein